MLFRPVRIAVIGAGNRAGKYLEYARRNPDRLQLAAVADVNGLRRRTLARAFALPEKYCFARYDDFFAAHLDVDMVLVSTPDHVHFDPVVKAIRAGYAVLLEKPIAQRMEQCVEIARLAREQGVPVGVCHELRYHPYFRKIRELIDSGRYGRIVSVGHTVSVGLDRSMHSYVRGMFRRERESNPLLLAKCCHDLDFLVWILRGRCRRLSSFGSLGWFRPENAPPGCAERCIDCPLEPGCAYSARELYFVRRDWISNFDVPDGATPDEAILRELRTGPYGRCVYRCDNDVVDHQVVAMEMEDGVTVDFSVDMFTADDFRTTRIRMTEGEIDGNEYRLRVRRFRTGEELTFDFSDILGQPYHAGADLRLIEDFVEAVRNPGHRLLTSIGESVESHRIAFEAERSRLRGETLTLDPDRD